MKKLVFTILVVIVLLAGCAPASIEPSSSTPIPSASEYPADISGRVTIAETVKAKYDRNKPDTMELNPLEGKIFWIVDISVANKTYKGEITANYKDWKIIAGSEVYDAQKPFMDIWPSVAMTVPVGGTGQTIIRFPVPDTLKVSDAKFSYQGQEPYSYGKLTGGEMVAVYDWDLKKVVQAGALTLQPAEGTRANREVFQYPSKLDYAGRYNILSADLKVVQEWHGTESTVIKYTPEKSPWVINAYYNPTSKLQSSLAVSMVPSKAIGKSLEGIEYPKAVRIIDIITVTSPFNEVGEHKYGLLMATYEPMEIKVEASGCEWTIKIGIE